ncbi:MAG: glycoside hydrolase domain-containing protein [Cyanobacteria bacterium P01_E01_bin.34]
MPNARLNGIIQAAPNGLLGFESDSQISLATAQEFYNQGYKFCIRHIALDSEEPEFLSYQEAREILDSGLALMPVQHSPEADWSPFAGLGTFYGETAAAGAAQAGLPSNVNVWCVLENVNSSATVQDIIDHCNAWYDAVAAWEYVPGLYVGANSILDGEQFNKLKFQHFWSSENNDQLLNGKDFQMVRSGVNNIVNGINITPNNTCTDRKYGQPHWLISPQFA